MKSSRIGGLRQWYPVAAALTSLVLAALPSGSLAQSQLGGFPIAAPSAPPAPFPMAPSATPGGFPMAAPQQPAPFPGTATQPAPGGQPQWFVSQSQADNSYTLTYGVPETDNVAFVASCGAGGSAPSIAVLLPIDLGPASNGQAVRVSLSVGQRGGVYTGTAFTDAGSGQGGLTLNIDLNDPLWSLLQGAGQVVIGPPGMQPMALPLDGAGPQVQGFLTGCSMQFAAAGIGPAAAPTSMAPQFPMAPQMPTGPQFPMTPQLPMAQQMPMAPTTPTAAPPTSMTPASVPDYVTPAVYQLGKWVEGLSYDGQWLWAAESGQRTIAKIDPQSGNVVDRVTVGRLPVSMASAADGTTYALVETDKALWRQPSDGRGSVFVHLRSCPQDMTLAGDTPWVLVMPDCSSGRSQVVRVDPGSGRQATSPELGEWGQALTPVGSQIWVAHVRGDAAISITEQATMRTNWVNARGASLWSITANGEAVYGGGRVGDDNQAELVVMFDPSREIEIGRATVSERVAQITSDDQHVIAIGEKGTIWVLSAQDLSLERTIMLTTGEFEPKAALLEGNALLVTAGTYHGDTGAVLVVNDVFP